MIGVKSKIKETSLVTIEVVGAEEGAVVDVVEEAELTNKLNQQKQKRLKKNTRILNLRRDL
jgi:hypothetical protein